ncbi:MAG: DUF882 domain-containing protein [Granulosicoccaceae bacterium]
MHRTYSRRRFVTQGLGLGGACLLPTLSQADNQEARKLSLHSTHTGESLTVTYFQYGGYDRDSLQQLNTLLRDHRQNVSTRMDPALFDQLWHIQQLLQDDGSVEIISGFRTTKTNNMLRRSSSGVASNSYHPKGQAIDFRLPAVSTQQVRNVALHLQNGGVGYYRKSNFVHIDSGPIRAW